MAEVGKQWQKVQASILGWLLLGELIEIDDEERACAWGETGISRKLANQHRALQTTRQS